jgi:ATP-dependent DNA helicase RecQ
MPAAARGAEPPVVRGADADAADGTLFQELRALRRRIAEARGVPAFLVFSDVALRQMAERRPRSELQLLAICGVGPKKLAQYGEPFLKLLRSVF